MTLSRHHFVLLAMLVVIGGGIWIAISYVERVYKEREKETDLIKNGKAEDLIQKSPPKPPGLPPVERSTSRQHEVLRVSPHVRAPVGGPGRTVSIRGNGEFTRLPALPDEGGPVVTGLLDRTRVDQLLRRVMDSGGASEGAYDVQVLLAPKATPQSRIWDRTAARELLELTGREMNRNAIPEQAMLMLAQSESGDAIPWPFERQKPEAFDGSGKLLVPESDRARFRQGLLKLLETNLTFSGKDKVWRVVHLDLICAP